MAIVGPKYWRDSTLITMIVVCSVVGGGMVGFIIGYTHAPEKKCRPEAISSTVSKDGLSCVYQQAQYGMARRIEK